MGRSAVAWRSITAHNLATYSQSELGFASNFNIYPGVQLPPPNGSLGYTRGQMNCAMARWKALINAVMPVYFAWNEKSHIPNGTAKSVESHSLSNSESGGVSVDDCAKTEILVCLFDAVPGPGTVPGPETASNRQTSISVMTTEPIKTPLKVAFSALKFSKSASYAYKNKNETLRAPNPQSYAFQTLITQRD
jgi:hypothetical protein